VILKILKSRELSISFYLAIILVLATVPALISAYLSLNKADEIQEAAKRQTRIQARLDLKNELERQSKSLARITFRISQWNETRVLFNDSTYYNYWKDSRVKEYTGHQHIFISAIDLYKTNKTALTNDYTLSKNVFKKESPSPAVIQKNNEVHLVFFRPIHKTKKRKTIIGYLGIKFNLINAINSSNFFRTSNIKSIKWEIPKKHLVSINTAIKHALLDISPAEDLNSLVHVVKGSFIQYFIYIFLLFTTFALLLIFFIARPLSKLARYLRETDFNHIGTIPSNVYGPLKIREFENVRQALNDYKDRFQFATANLEKTNKELLHLTYNDPLTNCANRRSFERRLKSLLKTLVDETQSHALCYIDVDQFKVVNDTCGHVAGDELLRQIALLLESQIRASDLLARLGGDEFGVIISNCDPEHSVKLAEKLRNKVKSHHFVWQSQSFDISVSIGLVPINLSSCNMSEILKNADAACYVAKDAGRNRVHVYEANDQELALRYGEMQWVSRIQTALKENRFVLFGQKICSLKNTEQNTQYEVLLRYIDESGKFVLPMAFIPAAERYSLMQNIDKWVIARSLKSLAKATKLNKIKNTMLFINLSGQSIGEPEILDFIKDKLQQNNVEAKLICFEITETAAIANLSQANEFINQLRNLGCRFALDDFGSGLSSFGYLNNLKVDYIKIDGHFIKQIKTDPLSRVIVDSINRIGIILNITTIAEFVEDHEIIKELKKLNIDYAQGYGIHKPTPLNELLNLEINSENKPISQ